MTDRDLTAGMIAEVQAKVLRPALFLEGEFATGTLRLWTGIGQIPWNGQTWTGAGNLIAISAIQESADIEATGFTVSLSGQPSASISLALQSCRQGKPCKIWLGMLDAAGAVIADPYLLRQGRLDVPSVEDSGNECVISIAYEDRLVDLERARERRYTSGDQAIDWPLDLGFAFVPSLQSAVDVWGRPV